MAHASCRQPVVCKQVHRGYYLLGKHCTEGLPIRDLHSIRGACPLTRDDLRLHPVQPEASYILYFRTLTALEFTCPSVSYVLMFPPRLRVWGHEDHLSISVHCVPLILGLRTEVASCDKRAGSIYSKGTPENSPIRVWDRIEQGGPDHLNLSISGLF